MADGLYRLDDETFPGLLAQSLDGSGGRPTLGNVSLGSGPGLPVAASTVAKVRAGCGNRGEEELSFLEGRELQDAGSHSSMEDQPKFTLSFKDDLDTAADFLAAHRLSDVLLKVSLDETASKRSMLGLGPTQAGGVSGWPTELRTDLSTGLLTMTQFGQRDAAETKAVSVVDDPMQSEGVDSDRFSSNSSFLANEKLMSVDSLSSNATGDPACPLLPYLMKEYTNGGSNPQEQYFGLSLCRARMVIECAFGRFKARFGALRRAMYINLNDLPFVIYACFVLLNFCEINKDSIDDSRISEAIEHDREHQPVSQPPTRGDSLTTKGKRVRRVLTQYLDP